MLHLKHPLLIYQFTDKILLVFYFIKLRKFYQIFVEVSELLGDIYIIYDGPGFLSDVLENKRTQITSNLQCIIQILGLDLELLNYCFKFTSNFVTNFISHKISSESVVFMGFLNNQCQSNLSVVSVHTDHGYHVIITVHKFTTSGIVDPGYKYAGIVLVKEWNNNSYREREGKCHIA